MYASIASAPLAFDRVFRLSFSSCALLAVSIFVLARRPAATILDGLEIKHWGFEIGSQMTRKATRSIDSGTNYTVHCGDPHVFSYTRTSVSQRCLQRSTLSRSPCFCPSISPHLFFGRLSSSNMIAHNLLDFNLSGEDCSSGDCQPIANLLQHTITK